MMWDMATTSSSPLANPDEWPALNERSWPVHSKENRDTSSQLSTEKPIIRVSVRLPEMRSHWWAMSGISDKLEGQERGDNVPHMTEIHIVAKQVSPPPDYLSITTWKNTPGLARDIQKLIETPPQQNTQPSKSAETMEVTVPGTDYKLLMKRGGELKSVALTDELGCLVLCPPSTETDEPPPGFAQAVTIPPGIGVSRVLSSSEKRRLNIPADEQWMIVSFPSHEASKQFVENNPSVKAAPAWLLPGALSGQREEVLLHVRWFRRAPKHLGFVSIRRPQELPSALDVLVQHNISAMPAKGATDFGTEIMLTSLPYELWTESELHAYVTEVLNANDIETTSTRMLYWRQREMSEAREVELANYLHNQLLLAAYTAGLLPGITYNEARDGAAYIHFSDRIFWRVESELTTQEMRRDLFYTMHVRFTDAVRGARVIATMLNPPFTQLFLQMDPDDQERRTYMMGEKVVYECVPDDVYKAIRYELCVIDDRLVRAWKEGDEEKEWTRISKRKPGPSDKHFPRGVIIGVRGWPPQEWKRVKELIEGELVPCTGGMRALLTMFGREKMVRKLREKFVGKALIDPLPGQDAIRVVASRVTMDRVKRALIEATWHVAETRIPIGRGDRFVPAMEQALRLLRRNRLAAWTGVDPAKMSYDSEKKEIIVSATAGNHELLQDTLDEINDRLLLSYGVESRRPTCPVCLCPVGFERFELEQCGHAFCPVCLFDFVKSELAAWKLPLKCCAPDCDETMSLADIQRVVLGEEDREKAFDGKKMVALVEVALKAFVKSGTRPGLTTCPNARCLGVFMREKVSRGSLPGAHKCECCGRLLCKACGMEPHGRTPCDIHAILRDDTARSLEAYVASRGGSDVVKTCPNMGCRAVVEKLDGCNHMQCVYCSTHWCWLCGFIAPSNQLREVYAHLQEEHGGTGGGFNVEAENWMALDEALMEQLAMGIDLELIRND